MYQHNKQNCRQVFLFWKRCKLQKEIMKILQEQGESDRDLTFRDKGLDVVIATVFLRNTDVA